MSTIQFMPTFKQYDAWEYLTDLVTEEILFGGGAGGGKSYLGCVWLGVVCLTYPGSRWVLARAVLKNLKATTLLTFFEVLRDTFNLQRDIDFWYKETAGVITFFNGSEVYLKDLFQYPSDPEFDSLGSTEYCGGFIDEGSQVTRVAKETLLSRFRYKLDEFGIVGKLLVCTNPTKGWCYSDFYKPWRDKHETETRKFIQALANDNEHLPASYVNSLGRRDEFTRKRLLLGDWEYDASDAVLFPYDNILNAFTNEFAETGDKYISADIALKGSDLMVLIVWNGLRVEKIYTEKKTNAKHLEEGLVSLCKEHKVPRSNVIYDNDGVGAFLGDYMQGIKRFKNGGKVIKKQNYTNLKNQCYYKLAEMVQGNKIFINCSAQVQDKITEELQQIKMHNVDKDGKLCVTPKDQIKKNIGRSPDFADALMMRMYFELKNKRSKEIISTELY